MNGTEQPGEGEGIPARQLTGFHLLLLPSCTRNCSIVGEICMQGDSALSHQAGPATLDWTLSLSRNVDIAIHPVSLSQVLTPL